MANEKDTTTVHRIDQEKSDETEKPTYVRKLNFGRSILTLDTVKQFHRQKDGTLLINRNLVNIPCTEKIDFVRKWIESHEKCILNSANVLQLSPTLDSSAIDRVKTSPVFGKRRKRVRKKCNFNDSVINSNDRMHSSRLQNMATPNVERNKRMKIDSNSRTENIPKNLLNSALVTARVETFQTNTSPVLRKSSYKNSRRKIFTQIENICMETSMKQDASFGKGIRRKNGSPILAKKCYYSSKRKREIQSSCVDSNMNSIESSNLKDNRYMETSFKITCTQKQDNLIKKLETSLNDDDFVSSASKDSKISEDLAELDSVASRSKLHIEDSPRDVKDNLRIEIESSISNEDNCKHDNDIVNTSSETDKDLSDLIEDTDMQDVKAIRENSNHGSKHSSCVIISNVDSSSSQISTEDSDQTYFEKAEQLGRVLSNEHNNPQSSQEISQVSSQVNNDLTDVKSTQSGIIISTDASPSKTYPEPSVQLSLLDSGKKRKKPKRGSLSERLQSTINRQVSFVRVWRYQLKQIDKDNISVPCVTICVHACVTRFSRQFLEGIVMEDTCQLLSPTGGNNSSKRIKIMTIPNIVGKVEIKSTGMVQIFPPWEVLDNNELILHVTYIRVVPDNKNMELNRIKPNRVKEMIVEEFSCPCMDANRMISCCTDRTDKPDVIEKLFID